MTHKHKPSVAVYKFSSCDGCQLSLLNLEDELLELTDKVEIAYFLEARRRILPGPYDIALVEGSVSTAEEIERINDIRKDCQLLIALGTCATAGGVQALRNFADLETFTKNVYPHPEYIHALPTSTPLREHVKVDLEMWGCPVNKYQMVEVIAAVLQKRRPSLPQYAVCLECKRRGNVCTMVATGTPCLGPITRAGCGAICPSLNRGCYGCFGPLPNAEIEAFIPHLAASERYPGEGIQLLRNISANAPAFKEAAALLMGTEEH
jgi:coenzyme F420-reducing hydrogenase gamma subunit